MIHFIKSVVAFVLLSLLLSGCQVNRSHYYWGSYEQLLYDMYLNPGKAVAGVQIEKLTSDIQKAQSLGKPVPPGVYAHLGFMYAAQGQEGPSREAFSEEQTLYPESKVFIEGMMRRASKETQVTAEATNALNK